MQEGIAREFVNRIQNLRKDMNLEVMDRIKLKISSEAVWDKSLNSFSEYICSETLATELIIVPALAEGTEVEIGETKGMIHISR